MSAIRTIVDADDIVRKYNSGRSVKSLANEFGVSRNVILHRLHAAGIQQRNRSESMYLRMAQTSPEERKRLASAANEAKRGRSNSSEMLHKRAVAEQRRIGKFESQFALFLKLAGIPVIPQQPFMSYNLDIGCGNVAVEIHTQSANPLTSKFIGKLMKCVNAGMNMIYVWIPPRKMMVSNECYTYVVSLVESIRSNPPARSKYWVVKGTGELYASGSFDCD